MLNPNLKFKNKEIEKKIKQEKKIKKISPLSSTLIILFKSRIRDSNQIKRRKYIACYKRTNTNILPRKDSKDTTYSKYSREDLLCGSIIYKSNPKNNLSFVVVLLVCKVLFTTYLLQQCYSLAISPLITYFSWQCYSLFKPHKYLSFYDRALLFKPLLVFYH